MKTMQRSSQSIKKQFLIFLASTFLFVGGLLFIAQSIIDDKPGTVPLASSEMSLDAYGAVAGISQAADLVIFSFDRPLQLYALLESINEHITGLHEQYVIYRASDESYAAAYEQVHAIFPGVHFVQQGTDPRADFKPLTLQSTFNSPSTYILFAVDDIIVKDRIDIAQCISLLEQQNAYGFFFRLGNNLDYCYACSAPQEVPPLTEVAPDVYAWQFGDGTYDWNYPHTVDMTLYRKTDIIQYFDQLSYHNPNQLEATWSGYGRLVADRCGLCFSQSKMVNLPLNRVQHEFQNRHTNALSPQELLEHWQQGLKLDIKPLSTIVNKAAHMDYEPTFIARGEAHGAARTVEAAVA